MSGKDDGASPRALRRLLQGYRLSQAIHVAAVLGIADLLAEGPRSAADLAAACGAHGPSLHRLLRMLASEGIFTEKEDGRFALTPLASFLRSDTAGSQRREAMWHGMDAVWRAWGNLLHSVRTGEPAFDAVMGAPFFAYLRSHPEEARLFDDLMVEETRLSIEAIVAAYDFSGARTIVDVGGGRGALLAAILAKAPSARGILFDQQDVVAGARPILEASGVADRCETHAGSFFESIPAGGDVYLLKYILHDWDDDRCRAILTGCRRAMATGARLLVLENPLPPGDAPAYAKYLDVNMLVLLTGRERTEAEYSALLETSGLRLHRVVRTGSELAILEAVAT